MSARSGDSSPIAITARLHHLLCALLQPTEPRVPSVATHDERTIMEVWRFGHFLTSPRHARRSATSLRVIIIINRNEEPPE